RRLTLIGLALGVLGLAAALVLTALNDSIVFFKAPSEIVGQPQRPGQRLRIGGLVKEGTVVKGPAAEVRFEVTDGPAAVPVQFVGLLPDLFRENQGVVAEGALGADGVFRADTVMAKHDERYMPREVADALKAQGRWQETTGK
ncbi:MAG: Cytochrome c-type biogenesis protein CcmE, heme chaperone, partial [uncultured Microvirga sp.]